MAVVVRLVGLPVSAGARDIRHFFTGLSIPDGGVHIIGGEEGEAFIRFESSKDARRALSRSEGIVQGAKMLLYPSSESELEYAVQSSRRHVERAEKDPSKKSGVSNAEVEDKLSTIVAAIKHGISKTSYGNSYPDTGLSSSSSRYSSAKSGHDQSRKDSVKVTKAGYLWLLGMPYSVTETEIKEFFHGLHVGGIMMLKDHVGRNNGKGLVKFDTAEDTVEGLKRHKQYIGNRFVEIFLASEEDWVLEGGTVESAVYDDYSRKRHRSPRMSRSYRRSSSLSRSRSPRRYRSRSRSRSPRRYRSRSRSLNEDYTVHLKNLSYSIDRRDVMKFFKVKNLAEDQIKFIYDHKNNRTREAFVEFKHKDDYVEALRHHKDMLATRPAFVFPKAKTAMLELVRFGFKLEKTDYRDRERSGSHEKFHSDEKNCIYVRNLPCDATKEDVRKLFDEFELASSDIHLLVDSAGIGLGEAVVKFKSEKLAIEAELLYNRRIFLGTEVLLRLITEQQMKKFGISTSTIEQKNDKREYDRTDASHRSSPGLARTYDVTGAAKTVDDVGQSRPFEAPVPPRPFEAPLPPRPFEGPMPPRPFEGPMPPRPFEAPLPPRPFEAPVPPRPFEAPVPPRPFEGPLPPFEGPVPPRPFEGPVPPRPFEGPVPPRPFGGPVPPRPFNPPGPAGMYPPHNFRPPIPKADPYRFDVGKRMDNGGFRPPPRNPSVNVDGLTTVKLDNLPFKVSMEEILDFFHGYAIIPETLSVESHQSGARAVISLRNYTEAISAVQELNEKPIGLRKIRASFY
ncbi:RNA-binding protein 12B-like [Protopterus annectens]|uniref:RNA-binding protein 12B-like n=1 Tax=Protopterus annectens TaxID=7888 RepID=UPI001CF94AE4|nr:RNA-binding protein 12B-like [Protopterus annectens]